MHETIGANPVIENPGAAADHEFAANLIRETDARAEVAQWRMVPNWNRPIANQHARRRRWIVLSIVVGHNPTGEVGCIVSARQTRPGGNLRIGYCAQLAEPGSGQVAILIAERSVVLPPSPDIQGQFSSDPPVILEKGVHVGKPIPMDDSIRSAACAKQTLQDAARSADQQVVKAAEEQEPALQAGKCNRPGGPFFFEAGANGVLAVSPGNLVGHLSLIGWTENRVQAAEQIEAIKD